MSMASWKDLGSLGQAISLVWSSTFERVVVRNRLVPQQWLRHA